MKRPTGNIMLLLASVIVSLGSAEIALRQILPAAPTAGAGAPTPLLPGAESISPTTASAAARSGRAASSAVAPNVLDRSFEAPAPNRKWIADFTYVEIKSAATLAGRSRRRGGTEMARQAEERGGEQGNGSATDRGLLLVGAAERIFRAE
jgi:transposase InsO family protein